MSLQPSQRRRRQAGIGRAAIALVLALAGHVAFLGLVLFLSLFQFAVPTSRPRRAAAPRPVTMRSINAEQWAKNRGEAQPSPTRDESKAHALRESDAPRREKKPEERPDGQIVDVAPGNGQESPDAKYLAESSNRVDKETRAREQTPLYRNAMPKRTSTVPNEGGGKDAVDSPQVAGNNGVGDDDRPLRDQAERKGVFEVPDVEPRQEVALRQDQTGAGSGPAIANRSETAEVVGNSKRLKIVPGSPGGDEEASAGRRGTPGVANLMPSSAVLDKISGAAANDHLGDVEEGEGTYLNTKEWKYSSFFNRVKQSVGLHWNPGPQLRQRDPSGQIYGGRDRYTMLNVRLNERGMVKDIFVEKSCGLDFLDLEAIQSFERAQPFPNPPPGLISTDSTVQFSFGFFLEMGGGPRVRLFRSAN